MVEDRFSDRTQKNWLTGLAKAKELNFCSMTIDTMGFQSGDLN